MARTGYGRLSESLSDANAGTAAPPPRTLDGAALPAPEVDLAAPAPAEAAPPSADQPISLIRAPMQVTTQALIRPALPPAGATARVRKATSEAVKQC